MSGVKNILLTLLLLCTACTLNLEETYIEGSDNKVEEDTKSQTDPNVKANVKIPVKGI